MKKIISGFVCAGLFVLAGCNFSAGERYSDKVKKVAVLYAIDSSRYKNVTMNNVNARLLDREDFSSVVAGTYYNGASYIEISNGRCHMYTPECINGDYKGECFEAEFSYTVKAASENCVYICPLTMNKTGYTHNGRYVYGIEGKPFALYLPMYGYGENRVEVSSVLDSEICMPSGTYWKKEQ